jgi:hypothetical protein
MRSGTRSAGDAHSQAVELLRACGPTDVALARDLGRRVGLMPKADCEPPDIALGTARQAVERARRRVDIARRVLATPRQVSPTAGSW